jgi:hypothetical protein
MFGNVQNFIRKCGKFVVILSGSRLSSMNSRTEAGSKRSRPPKIERDIFGDEYCDGRRVFPLALNEDQLPEGARRLLRAQWIGDVEVFDLATVFRDALMEVDPDFWQRKLEELTPFEWKLQAALDDAEFRKKVEALLESKSS